MSIGYACLTKGVLNAKYKTCRKQNANEENLKELIGHNLTVLERMIDYNHQEGIRLFRMSSDLIPFGSDFEVNHLNWSELFKEQFDRIGKKIEDFGIRVSMHPGQYTVLNSPNEDVVRRAIDDLTYHTLFMDSLKVDSTHKIVLHIGGVYQDKPAAINRFIEVYHELDQRIKNRLIIENDDRSYTIEEVLHISEKTGAPVVYDNLHHYINGSDYMTPDSYWINLAKKTWKEKDGRAKVHYSQQQMNGRIGAHSQWIRIDEFMLYYEDVAPCQVDIMLEVKDKNLSAIKCMLATSEKRQIRDLEKEWARYKYTVLERSAVVYQSIRELLKDKETYPVIEFYRLLEAALEEKPTSTTALNALDHVFGYVKRDVTAKEKATYKTHRNQLLSDVKNYPKVKRFINRLAEKYQATYLLESLFFDF